MSPVHKSIDSPEPPIIPRHALQSQDLPTTRTFDRESSTSTLDHPIQDRSNLQSCPNDGAYGAAAAGTMANHPPSHPRIVPIMAGQKINAKPKAGSSNASSSRSSLRKRALRGEKLEQEELRIQCLEERQLYASPIKGDGNCLFYALSDQMYGNTDSHLEIRAQLVEHMRARPDYFVPFVADVGGRRRAPRRAAAAEAKLSSSRLSREATKHGQRAKFEAMMTEMETEGVWGGSVEIQAFCQSYGRDANIYSNSGIQTFTSNGNSADAGEERGVVHLAFHSFQHYSSVRAVEGPHSGLPCLPRHPVGKASGAEDAGRTNRDQESKASSSTPAENPSLRSPAEPWKISAISDALPGFDNATIREMLQKCRGDIDNAFAKLLDGGTSVSSSLPSSSVTASGPSGPSSESASLGPSSRTIAASSSRSSSRHSTASKRSAEDSGDEDEIRSPIRRGRGRDRKRRILDGVTVGFSVRHDEKGVVSFRLRVDPDANEGPGISEVGAGARASPGVVTRQRGKLLRNGVKREDTPSSGYATDSGADGTLPPPAESASQASEVEKSGEE